MSVPTNYLDVNDLAGKCYLCMLWDRQQSDEHVMPQWLSKFLRPKIGHMGFSWNSPEGRVLADKWTWTVPICEPCNGWMNDQFETATNKDLIKQFVMASAVPGHLSRSQQRGIAGWTLKTAIMVDAYESRTWDNPPHAPRSEIEFLYVHGVPSTHSAIWAGLMAAPYSSFSPPQNLAPRYGSDLEWNVPDAAWMPVHAIHQWCSLVACQVDGSGWLVDLPE